MTNSTYSAYLKSDEWRELRTVALARTGGTCQFCGEPARHVHHAKYPKRLGTEPIDHLLPVCERCHQLSHGIQMRDTLTKVEKMCEVTPWGTKFGYALADGKVYASTDSWARALRVPDFWHANFIAMTTNGATLKKDLSGGKLDADLDGVHVFRWHAVAFALNTFQREYYKSEYTSRPPEQREAIKSFMEKIENLTTWGYELQERALTRKVESTAVVPSQQHDLADLVRQIIGPVGERFHAIDGRVNGVEKTVLQIASVVPALRNHDQFITTEQGVIELGYSPNECSSENRWTFTQLVGNDLKESGAVTGERKRQRLPDSSRDVLVNTYRRGDIYSAIAARKGS